MKLHEILNGIEISSQKGDVELDIIDITQDSRKCKKGSLFIAIDGVNNDGHKYIESAINNGAIAVLSERDVDVELPKEIAIITINDTRKGISIAACNFFHHPSSQLELVGVTGTNGKTTIATLLYQLFSKLGYSCGLLSTIANFVGDKRYPTINTTADPISINSLLWEMVQSGCQYCFMEVSSHALEQQRVTGLQFRGAIFTNLTHDHLDYHKTFAEYLRCKKLLFDNLDKGSFALTNIDDKNGEVMLQNTKAHKYTYSTMKEADFKVKIVEKSIEGSLLKIGGKEVWTRFIGNHNAQNIVAVYGTAILLGGKEEEILQGISSLKAVAGRLEYTKGGNDITAVVDYAHTPDALENVLRTLKDLTDGSDLIAVFGCGGNRDRTKRAEMAAISEKYCNKIVVTSDNPRFENPEDIIKEIKEGFSTQGRAKSLFIADRREGIRTALTIANPGSIILVAGKGHEDYQIVNGVKHHFDDKEIIKEYFNDIK